MNKLFFINLLFITSCLAQIEEAKEQTDIYYIDLAEATADIRNTICENKFSDLLAENDKQHANLLLDNVCPAEMAFETEALSVPASLVYYYKESSKDKEFINKLNLLAKEYDDKVSIILVDSEALFILTQALEIEKLPAILLIKNRHIHERITENISIETLKEKIDSLLK